MQLQFTRKEELAEQIESYMSSLTLDDRQPADWIMDAPGIGGVFRNSKAGRGMTLSRVVGDIKDSFSFRSRSTNDAMIEVGVCLEGHINHRIKGQRQEIATFPGQNYISFIEGESEVKTRIPGTQNFNIMEIQFSLEAFDSLCSQSGCQLPPNLRSYGNGKFHGVKTCSCLMPRFMDSSLRHLLNLSDSGASPDLMEEFCFDYAGRLVSFLNGGMQKCGTILSSEDIERVREARWILRENLEEPPSLMELARQVGLNDYKLKTGFRQAYGRTMHQVLTEMRMRKAEGLLRERCNVSEAALASGYRNPGDFSIAFKNRYGSSPRQYRKKLSAGCQFPVWTS